MLDPAAVGRQSKRPRVRFHEPAAASSPADADTLGTALVHAMRRLQLSGGRDSLEGLSVAVRRRWDRSPPRQREEAHAEIGDSPSAAERPTAGEPRSPERTTLRAGRRAARAVRTSPVRTGAPATTV